jgi:hypothetical protein
MHLAGLSSDMAAVAASLATTAQSGPGTTDPNTQLALDRQNLANSIASIRVHLSSWLTI